MLSVASFLETRTKLGCHFQGGRSLDTLVANETGMLIECDMTEEEE